MTTRYYDDIEGFEARGIDYDLDACLYYNPQGFDTKHIKKVLAVYEGENDGPDWHWILEMADGRYIYLTGGCDYTGWDCQSSASHTVVDSPDAALALVEIPDWRDHPTQQEVIDSLKSQLAGHKDQTWREKMDEEFGLKEHGCVVCGQPTNTYSNELPLCAFHEGHGDNSEVFANY